MFNKYKSECEESLKCVFKYEETDNDGTYRRYFSNEKMSCVFIISPATEKGQLPMYHIVVD